MSADHSSAAIKFTSCSDRTEHICESAGAYLHHSPLFEPFSDETTEHVVGECDDCAEWNPPKNGRNAQ